MGDHDVCPSCGGQSLETALPGCETPTWSHAVDVDLFAAEKPDPGFPVHAIVVAKVAYDDPADDFGIDPTALVYTIEHGTCELRGEECIVEDTVSELGLHAAMFGVFDKSHRLEATTYRVRGWVSKFDVAGEPIEYDAGIEQVGDDAGDS